MESKQTKSEIVVAGEASESDDDDFEDVNETEKSQPGQSAPEGFQQQTDVSVKRETSVVVSGEASESDEEYEIVTNQDVQPDLPPLNVEKSLKGDDSTPVSPQSPVPQLPPKSKYNSLLCRKLRERNIALRKHIVDSIHQSYIMAAKDIHSLAVQLQKSHIAVQDVSFLMRQTTNGLFNLEDKVDIVCSCNILPEIRIPEPSASPTLP